MNEAEKKEYSELKHILCERGFFVPNEQLRWNYLFDKNANSFFTGIKKVIDINKQIELN